MVTSSGETSKHPEANATSTDGQSDEAGEQTRYHFEEYMVAHLQRKALPQSMQRRCLYTCLQCVNAILDQIIQIARANNLNSINCLFCPARMMLSSIYSNIR
jgi:hypothetical protein